MKLIDVIIPVYKAHSTLMRTLSSIACQSIVDNLRVTLVNDCCPEGDYQYFVDKFSDSFRNILVFATFATFIATFCSFFVKRIIILFILQFYIC